ncbi:MAG: GrpB family protein [Candidatus Paceibacterota bacterium]
MLSKEQEKWVNHLSNDSKIRIVPFDPTSQERFERLESKIRLKLGGSVRVEHHGASSLGISGQDEIDVYLPVPPSHFDELVAMMTELFGEPRSCYPLERVRFKTYEDEKRIDLFVINEESSGWLNGLRFEEHLKSHPKALEEYRELKESCDGLGTQEYYRRKIEFINSILVKT